VILSTNSETLDGLRSYLEGVGVAVQGTRQPSECAKLTSPATLAFVVFPDDFARETVLATIAELVALRPKALPVLVTSQPQSFQRLSDEGVLIVPRPAWGWTIRDAIDAHLTKNENEGPRGR
jgi:hypothetical protein